MAVQGVPVVIVEAGGAPVRPVEANYPLMTVAEAGTPITISDLGAPFIVQGYEPPDVGLLALAADDESPLSDDDGELLETF